MATQQPTIELVSIKFFSDDDLENGNGEVFLFAQKINSNNGLDHLLKLKLESELFKALDLTNYKYSYLDFDIVRNELSDQQIEFMNVCVPKNETFKYRKKKIKVFYNIRAII